VCLNTQLAPETPAYDLQQACGTGLQAAFQVANKIALGQIEVGIAGGVDTTSDAPIAFGDGLRKALLELNIAKTGKDRLKLYLKSMLKILWMHLKMVNHVLVYLWVITKQSLLLNGVLLVKIKML
jgi:acetyl-CoA C-acetyltransferase